MTEPDYFDQGAMFSVDRVFRYRLWRRWRRELPCVAFVMLNPSTADESVLDPTLRRCLGYALSWGCGSFEIANLFALRSTDPAILYKHEDPVGPKNDATLLEVAQRADFGVVAGWGCHGVLRGRERQVTHLLLRERELLCLAQTKHGHPVHPLYQRSSLRPITYAREVR